MSGYPLPDEFDHQMLKMAIRHLLDIDGVSTPKVNSFNELCDLTFKIFSAHPKGANLRDNPASEALLAYLIIALTNYKQLSDSNPGATKETAKRQKILAQAFGLTNNNARRSSNLDSVEVKMECLSAGAEAYNAIMEATPASESNRHDLAFNVALKKAYSKYLESNHGSSDPNSEYRKKIQNELASLLREHGYRDEQGYRNE